jgi:hypothetical protein
MSSIQKYWTVFEALTRVLASFGVVMYNQPERNGGYIDPGNSD